MVMRRSALHCASMILTLIIGLYLAPTARAGCTESQLLVLIRLEPGAEAQVNKAGLEKGSLGVASIDALSASLGATSAVELFPTSTDPSLKGWYRIAFASPIVVSSVVQQYQALSEVALAQHDTICPVDATPNDPLFAQQWFLNQAGPNIQAPSAWDAETGKSSVIVAILDTGVRYYHDDLGGLGSSAGSPFTSVSGNIWKNAAEATGATGVDDDNNGYIDDIIGYDFVDYPGLTCVSGEDCSSPDNDPADNAGHGTHVAGIVGAINNNDYGVSSVSGGWGNGTLTTAANGVRIMPLRIGWRTADGRGGILTSAAASALDYARVKGARIANCSFEFDGDTELISAVLRFTTDGGLIFHAAGNNNVDSPSPIDGVGWPEVISVAATDQSDHKASTSNYGTWVDVSAPGVSILSTYHDYTQPNVDATRLMSGTSMAAPMAAGVAALVWSHHPTWPALSVRNRVVATTDPIDGLNPSFAGKLGSGRVNARKALTGFTGVPSTGLTTEGSAPVFAWFDAQNDGQLEVAVADANGVRFYSQTTPGTFSVFYQNAAYDVRTITFGDYDNDGDADAYLGRSGPGILLRNDFATTGGFTSVAVTGTPLATSLVDGAAWADFDRDGLLDLYLVGYGSTSRLVRNGGPNPTSPGAFLWTTVTTGAPAVADHSAAAWTDYDLDGDMDLSLAGTGQTEIWRNNWSQSQSFQLISSGLADGNTLSLAWGDYDRDGDPDLAVVGQYGSLALYRNNGSAFTLVNDAGVPPFQGRMCAWADVNNDGYLDLYAVRAILACGCGPTDNVLLINQGGASFVDRASSYGVAFGGGQFGMAWGDYDRDGDQDVLLDSATGPTLFRNEMGQTNDWIEVALRGSVSNGGGVGGRVTVQAAGITRVREIGGGSGHHSGNGPYAHIGLGGPLTSVDQVRVDWPNGQVTTLTNVASGSRLTVTEIPGVNVTSNTPAGSFLRVCPSGDAGTLYSVSVDFTEPIRDIRGNELTLTFPPGATLRVYTGTGKPITAQSDATSANGHTTWLANNAFGGCSSGMASLNLNGVPIGQASYAIHSFDSYAASPGYVDMSDMLVVASSMNKCEGQPGYNDCANFVSSQPQCVNQADMDSFSPHMGHYAPGPPVGGMMAGGEDGSGPEPARREAGALRVDFARGGETPIEFTIPSAGEYSLAVYDLSGRVIERLVEGYRAPGTYRTAWNGRDMTGRRAGQGIYFTRLSGPGVLMSRKLILIQ